MIGAKRTLISVLVSLVLVGTAVASVWLMASAGVFTGGDPILPSAPAGSTSTTSGSGAPIDLSGDYQVAQPRDPFKPLVVAPTTTTVPGGSTTTVPGGSTTTTVPGGSTTTTVPGGSTTTTVPGSTTTTTQGNQPDGIRVMLLEVRTESGGRVAVVEVDGVTYTVGVGDTFATNFKVVSLSDNGGVFTYGSNAFTLAVGQSILK
jgi:hypothetical protein